MDVEAAIRKFAEERAETAAKESRILESSATPIVEITLDGDRVRFVFDYLLCYSAQSGSDWYEHHVWTGTARIEGDALVDVTAAEKWQGNVTEHAMH